MHAIDILFFAAVAAFLLFRLYSVLGQKRGNQKPEGLEFRPKNFKARAPADKATSPKPAAVSEEDEVLLKKVKGARRLAELDRSFSPTRFLKGAEAAFERILIAFVEGELGGSVSKLLSPKVKESFIFAIRERKKRRHKAENTLVSLTSELVEVAVENGRANLTVDFKSEQIRSVLDKNSKLVEGDGKTPAAIKDRWVFSKLLKSPGPGWVLVACN